MNSSQIIKLIILIICIIIILSFLFLIIKKSKASTGAFKTSFYNATPELIHQPDITIYLIDAIINKEFKKYNCIEYLQLKLDEIDKLINLNEDVIKVNNLKCVYTDITDIIKFYNSILEDEILYIKSGVDLYYNQTTSPDLFNREVEYNIRSFNYAIDYIDYFIKSVNIINTEHLMGLIPPLAEFLIANKHTNYQKLLIKPESISCIKSDLNETIFKFNDRYNNYKLHIHPNNLYKIIFNTNNNLMLNIKYDNDDIEDKINSLTMIENITDENAKSLFPKIIFCSNNSNQLYKFSFRTSNLWYLTEDYEEVNNDYLNNETHLNDYVKFINKLSDELIKMKLFNINYNLNNIGLTSDGRFILINLEISSIYNCNNKKLINDLKLNDIINLSDDEKEDIIKHIKINYDKIVKFNKDKNIKTNINDMLKMEDVIKFISASKQAAKNEIERVTKDINLI